MSDDKKTGTREWSDYSINICKGCAHNCRYCYARTSATHWGRIHDPEEWAEEEVNWDKVATYENSAPKKKGRGMFPTTHDITPGNKDAGLRTVRGLLEAGNRLLLCTKGHPDIVEEFCEELSEWRDQIMWRFTITHVTPDVGEFWEPGAPPAIHRVIALRHAYMRLYHTSVSMEPLLEPAWAEPMVSILSNFVSDTIWIGMMNRIGRRCAWMKDDPEAEARIEEIKAHQTDEWVERVYQACKDNPKVRWKDSYQEALGINSKGDPA